MWRSGYAKRHPGYAKHHPGYANALAAVLRAEAKQTEGRPEVTPRTKLEYM